MSLRQISSKALMEDAVPQAILRMTADEARRRFDLSENVDDFDRFLGAAFVLDDGQSFSLRHYAGHPPDTLTVYMPHCDDSVEDITRRVFRIVEQLDLPREALLWERSQDPDL